MEVAMWCPQSLKVVEWWVQESSWRPWDWVQGLASCKGERVWAAHQPTLRHREQARSRSWLLARQASDSDNAQSACLKRDRPVKGKVCRTESALQIRAAAQHSSWGIQGQRVTIPTENREHLTRQASLEWFVLKAQWSALLHSLGKDFCPISCF